MNDITQRYTLQGIIEAHVPQTKTLQDGEFVGYASTTTPDRAQDQMLPGAFAETLHRWERAKKRLPYVYHEHNLEEFLGTCETLEEDAHGLHIKGRLWLRLPPAQGLYAELLAGKKLGLSISFIPLKTSRSGAIRRIHTVDLLEISFVATPCNLEAFATLQAHQDHAHTVSKMKRLVHTLRHP